MKANTNKTQSDIKHSTTLFSKKSEGESFFSSLDKKADSFFGHQSIQPKLKIGQPNDKYEQEADRVADQVMRMPDPSIQRQEKEEEELQMKPHESGIQLKCADCGQKEKLQKKAETQVSGSEKSFASRNLSSQIKSKSGSGSRLPGGVQSEMGGKIGADFSGVNIHTDSKAVQMNRKLEARAFTVGQDIYFNKNEYNPTSSKGKHLLAHELVHTVQQNEDSSALGVQRYLYANCQSNVTEEPEHEGECSGIAREGGELAYFERFGPAVRQISPQCWLMFNMASGRTNFGQLEVLLPIVNYLTIIDPDAHVIVTGYSDCITQAGPDINRSLRYGRAKAVEQSLINLGVRSEQIWTEAAPLTEYLNDNSTPEGRANNRAVSISIASNIGVIEIEEDQDIEIEQQEPVNPCAPFRVELPSWISRKIEYQRDQINGILNLIDRKVGHTAYGLQVTGSVEAVAGGGAAFDFVGVVDNESLNEVLFEAAGSGQVSTGVGGGLSVRLLYGFNIIPIDEEPGSHGYGRSGFVYGISGSFIVGGGVSVSDTLILDIFDEQDHRGWMVFTLGAGAEAEIEASASYGTSGTELCEVLAPIISQIFSE